jgi:hypothetical protein
MLQFRQVNILRAPFKSPLPQNSGSDFPKTNLQNLLFLFWACYHTSIHFEHTKYYKLMHQAPNDTLGFKGFTLILHSKVDDIIPICQKERNIASSHTFLPNSGTKTTFKKHMLSRLQFTPSKQIHNNSIITPLD